MIATILQCFSFVNKKFKINCQTVFVICTISEVVYTISRLVIFSADGGIYSHQVKEYESIYHKCTSCFINLHQMNNKSLHLLSIEYHFNLCTDSCFTLHIYLSTFMLCNYMFNNGKSKSRTTC